MSRLLSKKASLKPIGLKEPGQVTSFAPRPLCSSCIAPHALHDFRIRLLADLPLAPMNVRFTNLHRQKFIRHKGDGLVLRVIFAEQAVE